MDEIEERAFRAYFRRFGKNAFMPSQNTEYIDHEGKAYIILSNSYRNLAVYRIKAVDYGFSLRYIDPEWFKNHVLKEE